MHFFWSSLSGAPPTSSRYLCFSFQSFMRFSIVLHTRGGGGRRVAYDATEDVSFATRCLGKWRHEIYPVLSWAMRFVSSAVLRAAQSLIAFATPGVDQWSSVCVHPEHLNTRRAADSISATFEIQQGISSPAMTVISHRSLPQHKCSWASRPPKRK